MKARSFQKAADLLHFRFFQQIRAEAVGKELDENGALPLFRRPFGGPGMGKVRAEQTEIAGLEIFHRVPDEPKSFSLLVQIDLNYFYRS